MIASSVNPEEELTSQLEDLSVTKSSTSPKSKSKKKATAENFNPEPKAAPKAVEVPNLPGQERPEIKFGTVADLYLYDQGTGLFMNQEKSVEVQVVEAGRFLCEFILSLPWRW